MVFECCSLWKRFLEMTITSRYLHVRFTLIPFCLNNFYSTQTVLCVRQSLLRLILISVLFVFFPIRVDLVSSLQLLFLACFRCKLYFFLTQNCLPLIHLVKKAKSLSKSRLTKTLTMITHCGPCHKQNTIVSLAIGGCIYIGLKCLYETQCLFQRTTVCLNQIILCINK